MKFTTLLGVALLSLSLTAPARGEGTVICRDLKETDLSAPSIDLYNVRCADLTTIRARLFMGGQEGVQHVGTFCLEPLVRRGKGDKEIGKFPERDPSEWAEVNACREAFVEIGCGLLFDCPQEYCVQVECTTSTFLPGYFLPRIDR
jgi:hypothetical protein